MASSSSSGSTTEPTAPELAAAAWQRLRPWQQGQKRRPRQEQRPCQAAAGAAGPVDAARPAVRWRKGTLACHACLKIEGRAVKAARSERGGSGNS